MSVQISSSKSKLNINLIIDHLSIIRTSNVCIKGIELKRGLNEISILFFHFWFDLTNLAVLSVDGER